MSEQGMVELAERLSAKAIIKLEDYLKSGERRSNWDGSDRLSEAEHLLNCAAALRATASMKEGK